MLGLGLTLTRAGRKPINRPPPVALDPVTSLAAVDDATGDLVISWTDPASVPNGLLLVVTRDAVEVVNSVLPSGSSPQTVTGAGTCNVHIVNTGDGVTNTDSDTEDVLGVVVAVSPNLIANFGRWYDVQLSSPCTDAAGTTPASASYQTIGAIHDAGAGAAMMVQATSGSRPKLFLEGTIPHVVFDGVDDLLKTAGNVTRGPFSIVAVVRTRGTTGVMWHHGSALLAANEDWNSNTTTNSCYTSRASSAVANALPSSLADNAWRIVTIRFDGSTMSYRINGAAVTLNTAAAALGTATFAAPLALGAGSDGAFPCALDLAAWVDYGAAISDGDAASVEDYFNTARAFGVYGFTPAFNIVADGNSWTRGYGASSLGFAYPTQLANRLGASHGVIANYGVDGQTTTQMEADAAAQIDPLIMAGRDNVILPLEIRNDIDVGGQTPTQAYNNYVTYCTNRRTAGWKVVACTCFIDEPDINTVNALIVANWATFADALCDFAAHSLEIMADTGDGLHPGDAGYGIMAGLMQTALP